MKEQKLAQELLQFIEKSPSCFHTIRNVESALKQQDFIALEETKRWALEAGKKYYVKRNDSSIIAFCLPKNGPKGFHIIASHSDSPSFKLKEQPELEVEKAYWKLNVEKYGGGILSTWMDRPLSVAGRVILDNAGKLESRLINFDQDFCIIPNLCIHFNRDMNKGVEYNPQVDMQPLFAGEKQESFMGLLAGNLTAQEESVQPEQILGTDLFLYNRQKGTFLGANGEFIGAPRLDDTQCVFASLQGFLQGKSENYMNVCAVFDNEEVGSRTRQGADSDFLDSTIDRILQALQLQEDRGILLGDSFLLSADNGHALHPNHPEKSDPKNRPVLNGGIVIKYHGNQQYTTDGFTGAFVKQLCNKAQIPYQTYTNRADIAGGSTLGNISISHASIPSADVGLAQLAMHSAFETAGTKDTAYFVALAETFYSLS